MTRIGLVLGAGGVVGHAFHAGVLSAVVEATGWDPRDADVIVGTSAGSVVGALLRAGYPAGDLASHLTGEPVSAEGARLAARAERESGARSIPSRAPRATLPVMSSPGALLRAGLTPWQARVGVLAAAAMPAGTVPIELVASGLRPVLGHEWPDAPLWVNAVRLDTGRRVVFGRDGGVDADVTSAVAASCAIPGFFSPVSIDGVRYVDGGAHSPTNADLLAGLELDLVVAISPMSVVGRPLRADLGPRRLARFYLGREAAAIRRRGTPVLAFQPTAADTAVMGLNAMDATRAPRVARQARSSASRRLERHDTRDRLEIMLASSRA